MRIDLFLFQVVFIFLLPMHNTEFWIEYSHKANYSKLKGTEAVVLMQRPIFQNLYIAYETKSIEINYNAFSLIEYSAQLFVKANR